jgi:transcriptional regulator with XRE-family HTH domain
MALYGPIWCLSMITGTQIRSARAALRWTIEELAEKSGLGVRTIKRFEQFDGFPQSRTSTLVQLKTAFEAAGIDFIGTPEDRPGIRVELRKLDSK